MTVRDEILEYARHVMKMTGKDYFTPKEIVDCMERRGSRFTESSIRTHVTSRMCREAPKHHGVVHDDLTRIGRGRYTLIQN